MSPNVNKAWLDPGPIMCRFRGCEKLAWHDFKYQALIGKKLSRAPVSPYTDRLQLESGELQMLKNVFNFKWLQVVFFAGALAGMGMGFGAGLLLAQKPGKDLRDELTDKTLNLVDGVKSRAGEVKEKMDSFVSSRQHDGQFESNS